jgi:hypothetical protein
MFNFLGSSLLVGTFVDIEPTDITAMLGYVKSFITDLTPLLIPVLAIGLGIFIFWAIVSALK